MSRPTRIVLTAAAALAIAAVGVGVGAGLYSALEEPSTTTVVVDGRARPASGRRPRAG